ncbi:MAG: sulfatase [Sedimentisphaeraceae bacterium JB056]
MRILYIDIDTLRPDHLGCYGYHRNTSPNIDKIASEGVRFENYYCSDAPCLPSRTALMTGKFGINTGVVNHGGLCADIRPEGINRGIAANLSYKSLPGYLRRSVGLHTVSISPFPDRHGSWVFNAGFAETHDHAGKRGHESAEDITPVALEWIDKNASKDDWFLHINYWDPHTHFRAPEEFGNPFENDPLPDWITDELIQQHQQSVGPHSAREILMYSNQEREEFPRQPGEVTDRKSMRRLIDGYDCGIRYCDQHLGQLFEALETQGVLDDVVIIISADHGENYGELGIYAEHATADYATCHIPLIIKWPGKSKAGHVDRGLHYNIDLLPTLEKLTGIEHNSELYGQTDWQGLSFDEAVTGTSDCSRDYLVLSQCAHVCQRSVRWDNWLYIRTYHDGFHLFDNEMLFDIEKDPYEQVNLAKERPDLCQQACGKYMQWHDQRMIESDSAVDPLWQVMRQGGPYHAKGHLKQYCRRLEETQRGWAVKELQKRHPGEFVKEID